jgi:Chalcone isomerase-like
MQRRTCLAAPLFALPWVAGAQPAAPPELRGEWPAVPAPQWQGQATMRFLGLRVYDIALWAPAPVRADDTESRPLALVVAYRRALSGERIAERSLAEMRRGGPVDDATAAAWLAGMRRLFPDVADGDRITGVQRPGQAARFHVNGGFVGEVREARFAALFFGIWLSPWTSEPALRQALLGSAQ